MARILVNWFYNEQKDEYIILDKNSVVYADMDVAVLNTNETIGRALIVPIRGENVVVDREKYESLYKFLRYRVDKDGNVIEDPKSENATWIPRNTDISKLKIVNGMLVLLEEEEPEPQKELNEENLEKREA